MIWLTAFIVTFIYVFLRVWQQTNVIHKRYSEAGMVAFLLAICEVTTIGLVVNGGFWLFLPIGAGGCLGVILSMKVNHR